jgi:hypothetical protein
MPRFFQGTVLMLMGMTASVMILKAETQKDYVVHADDMAVIHYILPPKERLAQKIEKMTELMKDTKLSLQLLCVAAQCIVVEVPLAVAIQILLTLYEETAEWPVISFLLMLMVWFFVCFRVKKAWDYYMSDASSSDEEKPIGWRMWLFGGPAKTSKSSPLAADPAGIPGPATTQAFYGPPPPTAPLRREPCWHCGMADPDHRGEDCGQNPRRRVARETPPVNVTVMAPVDQQQDAVRRVIREELQQQQQQQQAAPSPVAPAEPKATPTQPPPVHHPGVTAMDEILERRQQAGKRFSQVYRDTPDYVTYILNNTRLNDPQLMRFRSYCQQRRQQYAAAIAAASGSSGT